MNDVDSRIERLIVRRLDGELTPEEETELNRELLRSADARRMLSDCQQTDRWASEVVAAVADNRWPHEALPPDIEQSWRHGIMGWKGVSSVLAAAAVVLIVVGLSWRGSEEPGRSTPVARLPESPRSNPSMLRSDYQVFAGNDLPNRGHRRLDRDYVGILDEDRKTLYMLELNRTRTLRIPIAGDL